MIERIKCNEEDECEKSYGQLFAARRKTLTQFEKWPWAHLIQHWCSTLEAKLDIGALWLEIQDMSTPTSSDLAIDSDLMTLTKFGYGQSP